MSADTEASPPAGPDDDKRYDIAEDARRDEYAERAER
jgi:hypothetical protein